MAEDETASDGTAPVDVPRSQANGAARESLPEDLQQHYDALVADYRFYATVHHNHPFVSYKVLADLVRSGWRHVPEAERRTGKPTDDGSVGGS